MDKNKNAIETDRCIAKLVYVLTITNNKVNL